MAFYRIKCGLLSVSSFAALAFAASAGAQTSEGVPATSAVPPTELSSAPDQDAGEIIVTARRRAESLVSTPVAVSAISGATLQNYATTDVRDLAKLTPSLIIDRNGSGAGGTIALRGVSTSPGQAGFDQAVSVDVDGVQSSRGRALSIGLFDVSQVEVLRGPQALLFGKNSPGGVVSIKTAGPTDTVSGYLRGGYEFVGDEAIVEGAVGGPLSESFGARIALRYRNLDGYFRNVAGPVIVTQPGDPSPPALGHRRPGDEEIIGRATFQYEPVGSDFDATLKLTYSDIQGDGPYAGAQIFYCGGNPGPVTGGVLDVYGDCKVDSRYSSSAPAPGITENWPYAKAKPYNKGTYAQAGLDLNYDFSDVALSSVTGYIRSRTSYFDNFDSSSLFRVAAAEHEATDLFTQEVRLTSSFSSPINFMLGAFYQHVDLEFYNGTRALPLGRDPATGKYETWNKDGFQVGKTYSAFGQLIWDISDTLELAGGARFTREEKDSNLRNTYVHPPLAGVAFVSPTRTLVDDYEGENVSPEAILSWRPDSDMTVYGGYKTGFKSGGFGIGAVLSPASATAQSFDYEAEKVRGFEAGFKGRFMDRRITLMSAIYSYRYSNLQVNALDAATLSFNIQNAATARVKGVELESAFAASDFVNLRGSVAYNHARYSDYLAACYSGQNRALGCNVSAAPGADGVPNTADDIYVQDRSGQRPARAPDWTLTGGIDARMPLSATLQLSGSLDARYTSKHPVADTGHPFGDMGSYTLFDAVVRVGPEDQRWDVALIGRNLTNEWYTGYFSEKPGAPIVAGQPIQLQGIPQRGRQLMVQLGYKF